MCVCKFASSSYSPAIIKRDAAVAACIIFFTINTVFQSRDDNARDMFSCLLQQFCFLDRMFYFLLLLFTIGNR